MNQAKLPAGTVHDKVPRFVAEMLRRDSAALATWLDITPLARNEWICLSMSGKSEETKNRRLKRIKDQLHRGQRRPCCWGGCPHRTDKPLSRSQKTVLKSK